MSLVHHPDDIRLAMSGDGQTDDTEGENISLLHAFIFLLVMTTGCQMDGTYKHSNNGARWQTHSESNNEVEEDRMIFYLTIFLCLVLTTEEESCPSVG